MPGQQNQFPIETNDPQTAMLLLAWEMTKLTLYNRPTSYTGDEVREEYAKNYTALRLAHATQYSNAPARSEKRN